MKEEELIKKLESIDLPQIEVPSHRRRLRAALLDARYFEAQPRVTAWSLTKSKVSHGIDMIAGALLSRQPVWKTAIGSMLAVALIVGLILMPSLTGQSPEVLATNIVQESLHVQAALNGEEIVEVEVTTKVVDDEGNVLIMLVRTETRDVAAVVDVDAKQVIEVIHVHVAEFTATDEQKAIDIASADPGFQELLAQGASITRGSLGHSIDIEEVVGADGDIHKEGSARGMGDVRIELGDKEWLALIDLEEEKVLRLDDLSAGNFFVSMGRMLLHIVAPVVIAIGILILIGVAIKNGLALATIGIASIAFGIIGLLTGTYNTSWMPWNQAMVFSIPIIGLVMGILAIRQKAARKGVTIAGVVTCSLAICWDLFLILAYVIAVSSWGA